MPRPVVSDSGWKRPPLCRSFLLVHVDTLRISTTDPAGAASDKKLWWALGVLADGQREILGVWAELLSHGPIGPQMFGDLKDRGVENVRFVFCGEHSTLEPALRTTYAKAVALPSVDCLAAHAKRTQSHNRTGDANGFQSTSTNCGARTGQRALGAVARMQPALTPPQAPAQTEAPDEQVGACRAIPVRYRRTAKASQEAMHCLQRRALRAAGQHDAFSDVATATEFVPKRVETLGAKNQS